jgi:AIG2-like family.
MHAHDQVFPKLFGTPNLPSKHEVDWLNESVRHSPDLGKLEQYEFQLLFSPDETQRGYPQYPLIEDSVFLCHAFTQKTYNYWQQRDGQLIPLEADKPAAVKYFPPSLRIKGEVHAIRPYQFRDLDTWKQNTVQYNRKRVKLLIPHREVIVDDYYDEDGKELPLCLQGKKGIVGPEQIHIIRAWMYVGRDEYWDELLTPFNFHAVQHHMSRRPWLKEYYSYPKREITG